ncbi:ST7 homolog, partial [Paramuricea clavata]
MAVNGESKDENQKEIKKVKKWIGWSWTYLWGVWFLTMIFLLYILRNPLKLRENVCLATTFLNALTPKFYVALTATSSFISGVILIFELWYFKRYGTSFIEQISVNHLGPWLSGTDGSSHPHQSIAECKVWRNPMNLFRGAEYQRYTWVTGKEPLTFYDMNLSSQDHQKFFTCEGDESSGVPSDTIMFSAWRERNAEKRIEIAHNALQQEGNSASAYILLAEEEATTIIQ